MKHSKHKKFWSRSHLNTAILEIVTADQKRHAENDLTTPWAFSPETALNIVDCIFEDHPRESGRLTKHHLYAVGGYDEQRKLSKTDIDPQNQIIGILHDVFEDTNLHPLDAKDWGIEDGTVTRLHLITRAEQKNKITQQQEKEPYCDYVEILANDIDTAGIKRDDSFDNIRPDEPHTPQGKKLTKKLTTIAYLEARLDGTIKAGTPFNIFAQNHPERLPVDENRTLADINTWIDNHSSQKQTIMKYALID